MAKFGSVQQLETAFFRALRPRTVSNEAFMLRAGQRLRRLRPTFAASARDDDGGALRPLPRDETTDSQGAGATPTDSAGDDRGRKHSPRYCPTPSEARLLALLDRPRHGSELGPLLGVTRERVRQLITSLLEHDVIRSGDPVHAVSVIARKDDPSLLLSMEQERLLNRFPDSEATTLSRIANLGHIPMGRIARVADALCAAGLIETEGESAGGALYRLTAAGAAHWQRSAGVRRAEPPPAPPLPVRSDRVRSVLADLERHGPTRTCDIGQRLGIAHQSLNALMQYLKRKRLAQTEAGAWRAPYVLTDEGRKTLAALRQPAEAAAPASGS